jgi:hypothetical protein
MTTNPTGTPRYLRTPDAAKVVGLSIRTLEKHRIYGTGPRYSKLGGRVVYDVEDSAELGQVWCQGINIRPRQGDDPARTAAHTGGA